MARLEASERFRIAGRVAERESGAGVPGLEVRAYDRDLLFDDLLGGAGTDADGRFEISYGVDDFRDLFEARPDVYLDVYAPPGRLLLSTSDAIRWGASGDERIDLEVGAEELGECARGRPEDLVEADLDFRPDDLSVVDRDGFDLPDLPGAPAVGEPGAPALPQLVRFIALPLGAELDEIEVRPGGEPVRLPAPNPFPAQPPVPDVGIDPDDSRDGLTAAEVTVPFVPLDPSFDKRAEPYPADLAEVDAVEDAGPIRLAAVRVRPVQWDPESREYVFHPQLTYTVRFDASEAEKLARKERRHETAIGRHRAELVGRLLDNAAVARARDLWIPTLRIDEKYAYVIVTDNFTWPETVTRPDGTTGPPAIGDRGAALTGDLVAQFQRLADWKTARSVRSKVVTVSDIVDGRYGDFTQGGFARDLQEVIRNFLKMAQRDWDTLFVLLGGDVDVVPMRFIAGSGTYGSFGCWRHEDNPPPEGTCHVVAGKSAVKIHPKFTPSPMEPLSTFQGALRIPFDRDAGPGRLGWYFTSEADLTSMDEGFERLAPGESSEYVIVEGPQAVLDDDYYWVREPNNIPSDFYYASLVGPGYSRAGKHDFDFNNNGIYGQTHEDTLDAVDFWPDVWVGRAPTDTETEAAGFVNKVLTYERLRTPSGHPVDRNRLKRVIYASDWWGVATQDRQDDASDPPAEDRFTHVAGETVTKMRTAFDLTPAGSAFDRRLVAVDGGTETIIPYDASPDATSAGWSFATNDTYSSNSASPTRFVKVSGPEAQIAPQRFLWDPVGLEGAAQEKEALRAMMNGWFPAFDVVRRFYADHFDLPATPPLAPLEEDALRDAIDEGVHLLSLTGHGWWGGCCGVNVDARPDFANGAPHFIAYADSCSTARPDGVDSFGEKSVKDPDGGAVGYVGNTRYSWIGVGDNYEQFFWCALNAFRQLGPAAGLRLATSGVRSFWAMYAQNLYGDPEMPVYARMPPRLRIVLPDKVQRGRPLEVAVEYLDSDNAPPDLRVTVMGRAGEPGSDPAFYATKGIGRESRGHFRVEDDAPDELVITATAFGYEPAVVEVAVD